MADVPRSQCALYRHFLTSPESLNMHLDVDKVILKYRLCVQMFFLTEVLKNKFLKIPM